MIKKQPTKTSQLLIYLAALDDVLRPIISPYELRRRIEFGSQGSFNSTVYKFYKRGWIKFVNKNAQRFIKLTRKGELEALISQAKLPGAVKWDGKWRMIIFDIPEDAREQRGILRRLLKDNGFHQLQASVYINPYPLNRAAISYLQKRRLMDFIRIIKVEEMDNDFGLRKHFHLK